MRQVTIKELRSNLAKELENLPFEVTRKGTPIAEVYTTGVIGCTPSTSGVHRPEPIGAEVYTATPIDADEILAKISDGTLKLSKPLVSIGSRYDRPPLDLSVEAQAGGKMGH